MIILVIIFAVIGAAFGFIAYDVYKSYIFRFKVGDVLADKKREDWYSDDGNGGVDA